MQTELFLDCSSENLKLFFLVVDAGLFEAWVLGILIRRFEVLGAGLAGAFAFEIWAD
jgi:hypothetical protein